MITAMIIGGPESGTVIKVNKPLKEIRIAEPPNLATFVADKPVIGYKATDEKYILKQLTTGEYVYLRNGLQFQPIKQVLLKEIENLKSRLTKQEGILIGNF